VAPSDAPLAVHGAEILGKGDGRIAPIGAFGLYAPPIAQSAAAEPASMVGKGGSTECLPSSSSSPPFRCLRREQLGPQKARAEEHASTSVSSAFG